MMRSVHTWRSCAAAGAVTLAIAIPAMAADSAKPVTFSKDVAPIFQAKCQECHQPNSIAPMSLITYPGGAAVGALDQGARRDAPDAAVAHRPERRRAEVQERHVAQRRADRHDRPLGRRRRAAGRSEGLPPPKPLVTDNEWKGERDGFGPPDLVIKSSEYTMPAQHQDVWYRPMCDIPLTEPRWVEAGRDSSDQPEGAQDHPPLDRVSGAEQRSRGGQHRHRERPGSLRPSATISSTAGRS